MKRLTKEEKLKRYNDYLFNERIYPKNISKLQERQTFVERNFPRPSPEDFEAFDNQIKNYIRNVHAKTIEYYESLRGFLEGKSWEIETIIWPRITQEDFGTPYEILCDDYNPLLHEHVLDHLSNKDLRDLEKTEGDLLMWSDDIDNWGEYELPWDVRGLYEGLHISAYSHILREICFLATSEVVKSHGFDSRIQLNLYDNV